MNHTQKKYAIERVDGILEWKINQIKAAMPRIPVLKQLTYKQAAKLIKDGTVKLDKDVAPTQKMYKCKNITDMFDFSDYRTDSYNQDKYDVDDCNKKTAPLYKECQRIKDQIMLGDAEEALKLIERFSKM